VADQNSWWTGVQQAKIPDLDQVAADWGHGDAAANRLRMLNGAFEMFFILRKSIASCPDSTMRDLMTKELDDAGTAGMGIGVCDLDDAFQHWREPGKWTDNNTKTYMKANGIFGAAKPSIAGAKCCWGLPTNSMPGPTAATNFFNAMDSKMNDLSSAISGHNTAVASLKDALSAKNGPKTRDAFESISKFASKAKKVLFLAPKPNEQFLQDVFTGGSTVPGRDGSFNNFTDLNAPSPFSSKRSPAVRESNFDAAGGQAAVTFMQATTDVDTFLRVHKSALATGIFDNRTSTAFAALAVACSRVPVLGSFYAEVVQKLPGFFGAMKDMFEEHNRRIIRETFVNN
jgi:hypothetical protein